MKRLLGKFRGVVADNRDPELRGRIRASVPDVFGVQPSGWALPCAPMAGAGQGLFSLPPIGANVWIEFERGDSEFPVWVGGFWASNADVPQQAVQSQAQVWQGAAQHLVSLSDSISTPDGGGVVLRSATGATIRVNDAGIFISNGKGATLQMVGPEVSINGGALVVV